MVWCDWVLWHINFCRLFNAKLSLHIYIKYIRFKFGLILWHINHCRLFNIKFSLYIYIKYIWFWFGLILWHFNRCRLFNAKSIWYISGTLSSDCLVPYPGQRLGEPYPSTEIRSVYSTSPADYATNLGCICQS